MIVCQKLHLSVIERSRGLQQLSPIDPLDLMPAPFHVAQPEWCAPPTSCMKLQELGNEFSRDIGNSAVYFIGRNEKCHIVIQDMMVSRCHALLLHGGDENSYIVDVGSAHGTFIGNYRLQPFTPTLITRYSVLRFGNCHRQFVVRRFPKLDDLMQCSNQLTECDDRDVLYNTFFNLQMFSLGFELRSLNSSPSLSDSEHSESTADSLTSLDEMGCDLRRNRSDTSEYSDEWRCGFKKRDFDGSLVNNQFPDLVVKASNSKKKVRFFEERNCDKSPISDYRAVPMCRISSICCQTPRIVGVN